MRFVFSRTGLALAVAVLGLVYAIGSSIQDGSWRANALKATVIGRPWANFNDPAPALAAARRLRDDPGAPLYEGVHIVGASFLYPPLAAWFYRPLIDLADPELGLLRFNQAAFVMIAAMAGWLAWPAGWRIGLLAAAAALSFYPLTRAVELNQASVLVTLGMGLAFVAADRGRLQLAGLGVALAVAFKPHLVLMLPIVAWQARGIVLGAMVSGAVLLGVSLVVAGVQNHVTYVADVLPALGNGYAFFPNQSWNGLLNRLVHDNMARFVIAPPSDLVRVGTLALGIATIAAAMAVARRPSLRPTSFLLGLAWLAVTMASPIAWEHHYGPALFLFAIWLRERALGAPGLARGDLALAFAWIAVSNYFEVRTLEGPAALLASCLLFGALLLAILFGSAWARNRRRPVSGITRDAVSA